jgi:hypothetical protein
MGEIPSDKQQWYADRIAAKMKFIYNDAFCGVVLRNEAWLLIEDFTVKDGRYKTRQDLLRQHEQLHGLEYGELEVGDWERFWDKLVNIMWKENFNGN